MAVFEILLPRLREKTDENTAQLKAMVLRNLTSEPIPGLETVLPVTALEVSGKDADLKAATSYFLVWDKFASVEAFLKTSKLAGFKAEAAPLLAEVVIPQFYSPSNDEALIDSIKHAGYFHLVRVEASGQDLSGKWDLFTQSLEGKSDLVGAFSNTGLMEHGKGVFLGVTAWKSREDVDNALAADAVREKLSELETAAGSGSSGTFIFQPQRD